jgi:hypothetical protein
MSTVPRRVVLPSLTLITLALSPAAIAAQLVSARPASVNLTVVVPPHPPSDGAVTSEGTVSLIGASSTAVDLETNVGLVSRSVARIEVRLGPSWSAESTSVWVQNPRGQFEQLLHDASVLAVDGPLDSAAAHSALRFRVKSGRPGSRASLVVPIEYRLTVGTGDEFSVWSFPSFLRVDSSR